MKNKAILGVDLQQVAVQETDWSVLRWQRLPSIRLLAFDLGLTKTAMKPREMGGSGAHHLHTKHHYVWNFQASKCVSVKLCLLETDISGKTTQASTSSYRALLLTIDTILWIETFNLQIIGNQCYSEFECLDLTSWLYFVFAVDCSGNSPSFNSLNTLLKRDWPHVSDPLTQLEDGACPQN